MCGITGFLSTKYSESNLHQITDSLAHRGPDAAGYFFDEKHGIGLGHRSLSILDLSEAANQPMYSHCGRYVMVYNGEIYNFAEIRKSKFETHNWQTNGDSEVVLESFAKYGTECFSWFNGMFALAIWDKETQTLTIARDQIGIKPMFLYQDSESLVFASELKAIKKLIPHLKVNQPAFAKFLHLGYIPHPLTIFQGVIKLSAGSFIQYSKNEKKIIENHYWKISEKIQPNVLSNEKEAKAELKNILIDAVEKQLISDVPIGTFLSGGIDSSIVTAIAASVSKSKVNTFSIAITDGKVNEAPYAKAVAEHLGTQHHELAIKQHDIAELVPSLIAVYDEPFADSSAFPTMLVSKLAREHVTVTLSGDGGDELFLGYGMYNWANRLKNPAAQLLKAPIAAFSKFLPNRYQRIGRLFDYDNPQHFKSHLFSQEQYFFSENELREILVNPSFNLDTINLPMASKRKLTYTEQQSFWDLENYLKDDLLVKVDRASMKYSLETRVPLLDTRLIEFSLNLDSSLKLKNGVSKYLLKEVLYDFVPKHLFDRPKWGFGVPLANWLKTDLKYLLDLYTSKEIIEQYGLLHFDGVKKIKDSFLQGKDFLFNRLWAIIVIHWFLDESNK